MALLKVKLLDRISNLQPQLAADMRDIQLPWYTIRNQADSEDGAEELGAEVFIYDEIGGTAGVSADDFVKDLQAITADKITLRINSPGGSVFDAIAIYNALIQHPANIHVRVDALAASAASIIAMAGDTVEMMVGSQLMIHDALGIEQGNAKEMREMAKFLDAQSNNIASIYAERAGDTSDEAIKGWRQMMLAETWMFANEAVECGLADQVYMRPVPGEALEAEVPDEEDAPEEENPEEDASEDAIEDEVIENLMTMRHRLTNRNFRYAGRDRAPKPKAVQTNGFADLVKGWA
jgi:ATP-dependent protease ClpP protease subunit